MRSTSTANTRGATSTTCSRRARAGWPTCRSVTARRACPPSSSGRVIGKAIFWWPLSRENQLSVRADAGAVIADSRVGIPSVFLFRTGGDTTVRGYAFESLGVQQGSAVVGGRYYAVASVEVVHWINASLGLAAFVDAGNATDSASHLDPVVGYGVGGRLRTPIGPFRLDVAYGQETGSVRVHFLRGTLVLTNDTREGTISPALRRRRRWWRWLAWPVIGVLVVLALGYVALGTQAALDYVLQRAIADADGHLTIEGAEGSLLSTIRVARIVWNGNDVDVEARDIALTWSPFDLVSRRLIVKGLGAKSLALNFKGTRNAATGLPANLGLPLEVDVKNIGVQRLDWKTGEGSGFVTGVTFGYSGVPRGTRCTRCASSPSTARCRGMPSWALPHRCVEGRAGVRGRRRVQGCTGQAWRRRQSRAHRGRWRRELSQCQDRSRGSTHPVCVRVAGVGRHHGEQRRPRTICGGDARDGVDADAVGAARRGRLCGNTVGAEPGRRTHRCRPRAGHRAHVAIRVGRQGAHAHRCRRAHGRQWTRHRQGRGADRRRTGATAADARQRRPRAHPIVADHHAHVGNHHRGRRTTEAGRER